ncbi:class I adenylate-forming enzyme family protein [Saccharothrix texasensis]|uniref:Fatty acid CoA ligase FadD22 n=1 Tax=Saccharothrix texasensis TaxID=103734 RepID=A0A3N1HIB0_9PSEU|nr:AMP-binding protein [Saccharothrix texasensis]ROP42226.1 fatty acid CoA ligase FadD22 [Saccharothrix texasensis]
MSVNEHALREKRGRGGNLVEQLAGLAREHGWLDRPAYHDDGGTYRFADVYEGAGRAAAAYAARGLGAGSRIALVLPDGIDAVWALLGALRIGAVAVPVNSTVHPDELRRAIVIAAPDAVVCEEDPGGAAAELIAPEELRAAAAHPPYAPATADTPAYAVFTSGTTGDPKLCFHAHGDPGVYERAIGAVVGITPRDVTFSVSRLHFAYGLGNSVFLPLHRGGTTVLSRARATEDDALRIIEDRGVTVFYGQPSFYARLARHPDHASLARLRLAVVAGEVLPAPLEARLRQVLGERLLNVFGTTEIGHAVVAGAIGHRRDRTVGRVLPPYRLRIVDEVGAEVPPGVPGALEVAGPSIALGVARGGDPPARAGQSWYATGDAATVDEDGYVRLHGRLDDVEIVGGQNVHPAETEDFLMRHPGVREAAVCSTRRETGVTTLRAFVALDDDASPEEVRAELLAGARAALTWYKVPEDVVFVAELPRTPTGKLRRREIRAMAGG